MRRPRGSSPRRWWAPGRRGLAGRRWTMVAARVSPRGSVWSTENESWGGIGCGGEMGCSWALSIVRGRLAEAAEEISWWRSVEFNGATISSLECASSRMGNGGVVPLRKGKWRWRGSGRGGRARRDGSRPDGWWRCDIGPEEGDEGGAGRVGCEGRMGQMTGWASFRNGK
jgi:hypothetical protein